jgi:hypothetical protein
MPENESKYPECDKLLAVQERNLTLSEFLEWLNEHGIQLCQAHTHAERCYQYGTTPLPKEGEQEKHWDIALFEKGRKYVDEKYLDCGYNAGELVNIRESYEKLLARFFNIDLSKVEKEKRDMLTAIREQAKKLN